MISTKTPRAPQTARVSARVVDRSPRILRSAAGRDGQSVGSSTSSLGTNERDDDFSQHVLSQTRGLQTFVPPTVFKARRKFGEDSPSDSDSNSSALSLDSDEAMEQRLAFSRWMRDRLKSRETTSDNVAEADEMWWRTRKHVECGGTANDLFPRELEKRLEDENRQLRAELGHARLMGLSDRVKRMRVKEQVCPRRACL
jgi:hypothetical protein